MNKTMHTHQRSNHIRIVPAANVASRLDKLKIPTMLTAEHLQRAREEVIAHFSGVTRKVPLMAKFIARPYHSHLEATAAKVHWWGYGLEVEIAALHHDSPEDLPEMWSFARLRKAYGESVAELVDWVTQQDKTLPWDVRQRKYLERLKKAPEEAIALSCADKLVNMEDTIVNLKAGYPIETFLKSDAHTQIKKFSELGALYSERLAPRIVGEYMRTLQELKKMVKVVGNQGFRQ